MWFENSSGSPGPGTGLSMKRCDDQVEEAHPPHPRPCGYGCGCEDWN